MVPGIGLLGSEPHLYTRSAVLVEICLTDRCHGPGGVHHPAKWFLELVSAALREPADGSDMTHFGKRLAGSILVVPCDLGHAHSPVYQRNRHAVSDLHVESERPPIPHEDAIGLRGPVVSAALERLRESAPEFFITGPPRHVPDLIITDGDDNLIEPSALELGVVPSSEPPVRSVSGVVHRRRSRLWYSLTAALDWLPRGSSVCRCSGEPVSTGSERVDNTSVAGCEQVRQSSGVHSACSPMGQ